MYIKQPIRPIAYHSDCLKVRACNLAYATHPLGSNDLSSKVTHDFPGVYVFVNDILRVSKDTAEHYDHLKALFSKLHEYGLCINASECSFGTSNIDFLGFNLSEKGIQPLPDKWNAF